MTRKISWLIFAGRYQVEGRLREGLDATDNATVDVERHEIIVGDDHIPIAGNVKQYRLAEEQHQCEHCDVTCATIPALASHMSSQHGVKGKRQQKGAAA